MFDLVSLGECMIELFTSEPPEEARRYERACGGDTLNVLAAAARLGSRCAYVTRIANDSFGGFLLREWHRLGVASDLVRHCGAFNGAYFISTREDGEREFTYYRAGSAASELCLDDISALDFSQFRVFHTSGITQALSSSARRAALEAMRAAERAGCVTSFDVNFRPRLWDASAARAAAEEIAPHVHICFAGTDEDAAPLFGSKGPDEAASALHALGCRTVVLKRGRDGSWVSTGGTIAHIPARSFGTVLDTTGAGDVYAGAFLHGTLSGMEPISAARLASVCSGLKVLGRGATASLPDRDTVWSNLNDPA